MRDILVTLVVVTGCFYTLKKPYIGILLWSWLSYMNPHRLTYGFAYSMPFSQISAIAVFAAMLLSSKDLRKLPFNSLTVLWIIFVIYMGITTLFAYYPEEALTYYSRVFKIQLFSLLTVMLITDMTKLKHLIWVIVLSIGFFSTKGGVFTLLTGGSYKVWGPTDSMIDDNNHFAVAALMNIPLFLYCYHTVHSSLIKKGIIAAIVLSSFSVLGSQSRGALIAIATVAGFFWLKSKNKIVSGLSIIITTVAVLSFMPESWWRRMDTVKTYDEDASAMGRINAWEYAFNSANHNLFGMGFESWSGETFMMYAPNPTDVHAAHSIYFSVLGDHGWIGLFLFLTIFAMTWTKLSNITKKTGNADEFKEINTLSRMLQISLLAYLSGGTFLSLSYFDLPWHLVSFAVILEGFVNQQPLTAKNSLLQKT